MGLFQFGRKIEIAKEYSLGDIPVYSSLNPYEQKLIEKKARLIEFKRGDVVYEENTPPEAFYVVISGRFRLFLKARPGRPEKTLAFFHRGDHFSETSLLTDRQHSASVEARRDGLLLVLAKDDFLRLVKDIPGISFYLSRSLGHRLTQLEASYNMQEVKTASLYSPSASREAFQCWLDFARGLAETAKRNVIVVDFVNPFSPAFKEELHVSEIQSFNFETMDPSREADLNASLVKHPKGYQYLHVLSGEDTDLEDKKITTLLTFLSYRYDSVLLRLPIAMKGFVLKTLKLSDVVYLYAGAEELAETAQIINDLKQNLGFHKNEIKLIVPDVRGKQELSFEAMEESLGHSIFSLLPSREEQADRYGAAMKFLAKEFAGTLLGLALGSGAAYGLAHIGVLRVLEQEGIYPDVIAGSSMGALVGGLWAAGYNADDLERMAKSIDLKTGFFKLLGLQDMSIAHRGFFKGNQVIRFLESYLGKQTFIDLKIPVKMTAANLMTSEEVILDKGSVVDAIRASISIPGIFRPVARRGEYLIDGGVVDPLPVRVLSNIGVQKIIAVNVLPGPKDRLERRRIRDEALHKMAEVNAAKTWWDRAFSTGVNRVANRYTINIFNVIMSTIQFLEYEIAQSWAAQADVFIHPVVQEAHWAEFYSAEKFIKKGEEMTRAQLEEIKRLIAE